MDAVKKIATTLLYEGYILWPYRRSSIKHKQRWTFSGVYPRAYSEAGGETDPWFLQTQCILLGQDPTIEVTVRFLHVVQRQLAQAQPDSSFLPVDELHVGLIRYPTREEAVEREFVIPSLRPATMSTASSLPIAIPAGSDEELLQDPSGNVVGKLIRSWEALRGEIEVRAEAVEPGAFRLSARIVNDVEQTGDVRQTAIRQAFVSTHTVIQAREGEFISMTDPPEARATLADSCENIQTWPVLAGEPGDRDLILSAPIILSDYPAVAPESQGDLFDGTEIDQLLTLNVLSMTDEEKDEMRATDPKAGAILERTEAFPLDDFLQLHGAIREFQILHPEPVEDDPWPAADFELEHAAPRSVVIDGVEITTGSRVRLRPREGGDIFDLALAGKIAVVERIDQDYEDRIHLAVTIEDDPGRELAGDQVLGHRFFFAIDEVEPLDSAGR